MKFATFLILLSCVLIPLPYSIEAVTSDSGTVSITAIVPAVTTTPPVVGGGGGGGGGANTTPQITTSVIFKGYAYPGSIVTLLKDSQVAAELPASPDATFEISWAGIPKGTYNFGIRAQDSNGRISTLQMYTIVITTGVTTVIDGIFLSPTISIDKSTVKRGDVLTFFGKTVPKAQISLVVNSAHELLKKTVADASGGWVYKLDTIELETGDHQAKARGTTPTDITPFSQILAFKVSDTSTVLVPTNSVPAEFDPNKDQKVNISDFSIMAYWFSKQNPPATVDLNKDGKVDLADFSILAYYWTG